MVTMSAPKLNAIDRALARSGKGCPKCKRPNALTSRNVVEENNIVTGQVWCPKCDYSENVVIDEDGQVWDPNKRKGGEEFGPKKGR